MKELNTILCLILLIVAFSTILGISIIFTEKKLETEEIAFGCGVSSLDYVNIKSIHWNHPGRTLFENNCAACHTFYQIVVGPALEGMSERNNQVWVKKMILDGHQLVKEGNSYAVKQYIAFDSIHHPSYSFSENELRILIEYIDKVSEEDKKLASNTRQNVNLAIPDTKF